MSRLNLRREGEEHNFWQNYTDLMTGFLIVFIIASLTAYSTYRVYVDKFEKLGVSEANIKDIIIDAELYRKIKEFQDAQKTLDTEYFTFNEEYGRFEYTRDVQFDSGDYTHIRPEYQDDLIRAGKQLDSIMTAFNQNTGVKFKVVIEGRLANHLQPGETWIEPSMTKEWDKALQNSYQRAHTVVDLWQSNGVMSNLLFVDNSKSEAQRNKTHNYTGELFVSGAGYGGQNRYKFSPQDPKGEDRNKTFIIQVIPYINF